MDNDEQLQSELSNDGNEKIEGNFRVCESKSEFHIDNTDRMLKDDCESSMEMDEINQRLNTIIDNGPWIVNNKPMVMQKLDPNVNLDRTEPNTLPLWIKLMNPPLEAWSKKGLSALASRIGSPLIMDAMTTSMCNQGIGRLDYARVLVEVNANKGLEYHIDVMYRNGEQFVKKVRVEYDWKPPMCSYCIVFGHTNSKCPRVVSQSEHVQDKAKDNEDFSNKEKKRQKNKKDDVTVEENLEKNDNHDSYKTPIKNIWNVNASVIKNVRNTANKFAVLQEINKESLSMKLSKKEKEEVGKIMSMCVEDGRRYENGDVAEQFMKHFEGFLGINPTITKLKEEDAYLFGNKITEEEANSPDGFTSKLCKPKDQGGLGFKSLELWNKTLLVKHLWNVASRKESLWVKWINVVGEHMRYRIGDGKSNSVWHDNWNNETSLSNVISKKEIFYVGFSDHDKISDVMDGKAKKKLYTQDMLSKWYPSKVFECSLCKKEPDSHDHLFFNCKYAQRCGRSLTEELKCLKSKRCDRVVLRHVIIFGDYYSVEGMILKIAISDGLVSYNYGVLCEDKLKGAQFGAKTKTFEDYYFLTTYAVSNKEDMTYRRQLFTRKRVLSIPNTAYPFATICRVQLDKYTKIQ
ncbi:RNA-directed DNA polymerase, eukaryota, reverse transcriptase zinc-binding domain protein [Tanacetum coccineum]|uniref:RNA-directed DNA polymerase, eukaryota, reverse transcriptase zinc-binding domain protein n=1 Tax=Tanacetum coccineum TaxID=301880 RepID=A0ABQ5D4I5_9ASTR